MSLNRRVAVVGAGKMGETLIQGMLGAGVPREKVVATAAHQARLDRIHDQLDVEVTLDNRLAAEGAGILLLCVKPQVADLVLAQLHDSLEEGVVVVSILASASTRYLERRLKSGVSVVRAMPNTPTLVGAGMTAICAGTAASDDDVDYVRRLFEPMGRTLVTDEKHMDAITGLSASGPAFIYIVIEALAEGGVKAGLPRAVAIDLAAQTCLGAAQMVLQTGKHPALLKDEVTTPAGSTVDGILKLEEGGLRVTLIKAIIEAARRAAELVNDD